MTPRSLLAACSLFTLTSIACAGGPMRFDLANHPAAGMTTLTQNSLYSDAAGFGFEPGSAPMQRPGAMVSESPFRFSVKVPDGNYRVTLTLGDADAPANTTVKAEMRRLMLPRVETKAGESVKKSFIVNVRTPRIRDGVNVKISDGEKGTPDWDDKLTLEFNGARPAVSAIEIEPAPDAPTIFIAGDSTVCDQPGEPWAGWGMILPSFVKPTIAVANHAWSGRALSSFQGDRRLEKVMSVAKPGDFLFIQFGHNDMKEKGEGKGAYLNYTELFKSYIAQARAKGMTPVVVTSMMRRKFDENGKIENTFGDYIDAARKVAASEKVTLIDLNAMSVTLYETLGVNGSKSLFVQYPANTFPDQKEELKDNTHHNGYGAYELARCVVEGLRTCDDAKLRGLLADDVKPFDPARPDPAADVAIPPSPAFTIVKPEGN